MSLNPSPLVSIVAPCHNEAGLIDAFMARLLPLCAALSRFRFEIVFVDDGSSDATEAVIARLCAEHAHVKGVALSRNFGHQRAITAGLDFCAGDYVIVMDADLQDPPELIPNMLGKLEEGYDVVHAVRADRTVDSFCKRATAKLFYALMRRWVLPDLVENAADFKGFNRRVLEALRRYPERVQFLRGLFATLGFWQTTLPFVRASRIAGESKYHVRNVLRFARDAIMSNTALPLRVGLYFGLLLIVAAFGYAACAGALAASGVVIEDPLLHVVIALGGALFGTTFLLLGIIGEYLKCLMLEVKQRPLYIVRATYNLPADADRNVSRDPGHW